jgi:predicted PolB exonuclease-like 3'-5' exonuclease
MASKSDKSEVKFLVFDCESVADGQAIARSRYPGQELKPAEAIAKFRQELVIESGRDFIPYTYHVPVAIVVAKVRADLSLVEVVALDAPQYRPAVMTRYFWLGWEKYGRPTLVTFNGRSFDVPLLELAAYRYGVGIAGWFNQQAPSYQQYRNRYNVGSHFDLHEFLTNYGSTWFRGGLNLAAQLVGKPGKMEVQGDMVQTLYSQGKLEEINEYCRCDVLDTYFVFLRSCVLTGMISSERERELVEQARQRLQAESEAHDAYRQYLRHWSDPEESTAGEG